VMHHVYVWVRIYYTVFGILGTMLDNRYTLTIVLAGFTCVPTALGGPSMLAVMVVVVLYSKAYLPWRYPDYENNAELHAYFKGESARNLFENVGFKKTLDKAAAQVNDDAFYERTPAEQARLVFDVLDENKNGAIDVDELADVMAKWQDDEMEDVVEKLHKIAKDGAVDFETFYRHVAQGGVYSLTSGIEGRLQEETARLGEGDSKEKARLFFANHASAVDENGERCMSMTDLEEFLRDMGMPLTWLFVPAMRRIVDIDDDDLISLDEFHALQEKSAMVPMWKFMHKYHVASTVFGVIDTDGSGSISIEEIGEVLLTWGAPPDDVKIVVKSFDADGSGTVDFPEFFRNFQPMYEAVYESIKLALDSREKERKAHYTREKGFNLSTRLLRDDRLDEDP